MKDEPDRGKLARAVVGAMPGNGTADMSLEGQPVVNSALRVDQTEPGP